VVVEEDGLRLERIVHLGGVLRRAESGQRNRQGRGDVGSPEADAQRHGRRLTGAAAGFTPPARVQYLSVSDRYCTRNGGVSRRIGCWVLARRVHAAERSHDPWR